MTYPLFPDFDNEFFNHSLIPSFPMMYPFHYYQHRKNNRLQNDNINSLEKKLVDFSPSINLTEDENNYYIHADLPGMRKDQIKMEITDDHTFTISGERESFFDSDKNKEKNNNKETKARDTAAVKKDEKEKKIHVIECSYGKFERSFTIPEDADLNNIQAKNGKWSLRSFI